MSRSSQLAARRKRLQHHRGSSHFELLDSLLQLSTARVSLYPSGDWRISLCPSWPNQTGLIGEDDELASISGTQLGHGPGRVGLGGGSTHVELVGDLFVRESGGDEGYDFPLGQSGCRRRCYE